MKTLACLIASWLTCTAIADELVVHVEQQKDAVAVTCNKKTYLLKAGEANDKFLLDQAGRERGNLTAIFASNIRFESYFHTMSHLNKVGYEKIQVYILSDDKKSMMPFEIKSTGISVQSK